MSICVNPNCPSPENKDTVLFCQGCGSELLLDGRYRIRRELGGGGFGKTYEVTDCTSLSLSQGQCDWKVLKVLTENNPKYVELFQREAKFLCRLNHPGVPRVEADAFFAFYPANASQPLYCLVMEKIEGLDLKEYISRRGSGIEEKRAIKWMMQLVSIVGEIHHHNLFHRDIKPSNVMLRSDGHLVLIDFGTAREVTETYVAKNAAGQLTGLCSAGYTPLEQLHGQALPQSDFYSLGRTFVYLLTAKHPNDLYDPMVNELHWREAAPELCPEFTDLLDRLMANLPNQRPKSAEAILQELKEIYRKHYSGGPGSYPVLVSRSPTPAFPEQGKEFDDVTVTSVRAANLSESFQTVPQVPATPPPLEPDFISRCQQELADSIGPSAAIVCQRTLSQNPQLSGTEFVRRLAQKIPDPQKAAEFQKNLLP